MITYYLFGTTCVGKDYMIERALERYPKLFGAVQVGKEFRRRYPPERFDGKGAMLDTEDEAFDIFKEQWTVASDKKFILVAGQPRLQTQVKRIMKDYVQGLQYVLFMFLPLEQTIARLEQRFTNDKSSYDLSMKRMTNDKLQLYDVLFELIFQGMPIIPINNLTADIDRLIDQIVYGELHG